MATRSGVTSTSPLPGRPNVVPQNMPGAGSLKAINYLANQAPKDGSTIATFSRGIPMEPLMGNQEACVDPLKLNWIGSPSQETNIVFAWHATPFKVMDDLQKQEMIVASTGQGADTATFPLLLSNIFKAKVKVVTGYPGAAETLLAVERGEGPWPRRPLLGLPEVGPARLDERQEDQHSSPIR